MIKEKDMINMKKEIIMIQEKINMITKIDKEEDQDLHPITEEIKIEISKSPDNIIKKINT